MNSSTGNNSCPWSRPVAALLFLCLLLPGCSSTTFVYNRLDFILGWYLERYVDLDREQARQLDEALEPLLLWHRREELPRYVALLESMEAALDAPVSPTVVRRYSDDMELAWYRVRDRMLEELLTLGADLREDQLGEFIAALEKKQRKYERKYLERSEEEFRKDARENLGDALEDYLGRLDSAQLARVETAAAALWRSDSTWLAERAQWITMLELELQREPGWQARIRERVHNWEDELAAESLRLYAHNTATVEAALAEVIEMRSEKQDRRLRRRLESLREDLELLSSS